MLVALKPFFKEKLKKYKTMSYVLPVLEKKPEKSKIFLVVWYDITNINTNIKISNSFLDFLIKDIKVLLKINNKEQIKMLKQIEITMFLLSEYWIKFVKIGKRTIAYSLSMFLSLLFNIKNKANINKTEINAPVDDKEQLHKINKYIKYLKFVLFVLK